LTKLTGAPPLTEDAIPDAIPAVTPDAGLRQLVDDFIGRPDPDTYQLRSTRRQIEIERLTYDIIKTRLWPKFNLIAGVSQDQQKLSVTGGVPYMVRDYFLGGQVTWSVFDGFATKAAKSASITRRRQLEQAFRDQTADLIDGVRDRARQIDFAGRSLAMSEKLLGSAENLYRAAKEDLERGNTSEAAVNSAELNLIDSQIGSYGSRYDYMIRVADLVSVVMHDPALANLPAKYR
jgi:outer membrane protein TolC